MLKTIRVKIASKWIGQKIYNVLSFLDLKIMSLYQEKEIINLIKNIRNKNRDILLLPSELFMVYSLALMQTKIDGDFVEVGVCNGASSEIICKGKGNKHLYLFDTFNGLPKPSKIELGLSEKMFSGKYKYVNQRLSKYRNVHIYKGVFPKTSEPIKNKKFAFVHLDVDLYQSTKDCIEFFYKRMLSGGIILSHDYHSPFTPGVKKAFDEFFSNKPEEIIGLPRNQCMMIKK